MMNNFEFRQPIRLIFGVGEVKRIGKVTKEYGKRALLATYPKSEGLGGIIDKVTDYLKKEGIEVILFDKVQENPITDTVDEGGKIAREKGCDVIIGLGGGSAMDSAKTIAISAENEEGIWSFIPPTDPPNKVPQKALPIVLIATTAGTGSDADRWFVVTNPNEKRKIGVGFSVTYPKASIIDPELMLSLPPKQTASTGLDVLFHVLESYVHSSKSRINDMLSEESMRLVAENLEKVYKNGNDLEARTKMAWANTAAGMAEDMAGVVMLHSMGIAPGGWVDMPHGLAVAACILPWMRFSIDADPERFAKIAEFLGEDIEGLPVKKAAAKSVDAVERIMRSVDSMVTLSDFGIKEDMLETFTDANFKYYEGLLDVSPKKPTREELLQLYKECL